MPGLRIGPAPKRNDLPLARAMTQQIDTARRFLDGLTRRDEAAITGALTDAPAFAALGANLTGLAGVLDHLARQPTSEMYRQLAWDAPELTADGARAIGRMPDGAPRAGVVLTLKFDGNRIALVQQQNLPPRAAPSSRLCLTAELRQLIDNALATRHPMLLAYADERGQPTLSFRGSVQSYSDDQLALWVRNTSGSLLRSLQHNPKVALMYRDEDSKATYQFQGRARVTHDAGERQRIYIASAPVEQAHDFAQLGAAVIIDLDRVEGYAGLGPAGQIGRVLLVRGE